ncbi:MAG TPA: hypothetical protein VIW29_06895, partial [Polyangiaceae bacterium]
MPAGFNRCLDRKRFSGAFLDRGRFFSDAFGAFAKGTGIMKKLNRLGLLATFGSMVALSFSIGACGD